MTEISITWVDLLTFICYILQYPFCNNIWEFLAPLSVARVGYGLIQACVIPVLCYIADLRHQSMYGAVNSLYSAVLNLGFFGGERRWLLYLSISLILIAFSLNYSYYLAVTKIYFHVVS